MNSPVRQRRHVCLLNPRAPHSVIWNAPLDSLQRSNWDRGRLSIAVEDPAQRAALETQIRGLSRPCLPICALLPCGSRTQMPLVLDLREAPSPSSLLAVYHQFPLCLSRLHRFLSPDLSYLRVLSL